METITIKKTDTGYLVTVAGPTEYTVDCPSPREVIQSVVNVFPAYTVDIHGPDEGGAE
jgi:hypothetical protein